MSYTSEVLADTPLAYYRLDEASGTAAADSSGNGRHGTYSGSPALNQPSLLTSDADAAASFDGVDDHMEVTTDAAGIYNEFTQLSGAAKTWAMEFWIKAPADAAANTYAVSVSNSGSGSPFIAVGISNDVNKRIYAFIRNDGNGTAINPAPGSDIDGVVAPDNTRHHVVVESDGTRVYCYVDKVRRGGDTHGVWTNGYNASAITLNKVTVATLGRNTNGNRIKAVVDDVAFYDHELGPTRIGAHYDAGVAAGGAAQVSREWAAAYDVLNLASKDLQLAYDLKNMAGREWIAAYDLLNALAREWGVPYDLLGLVSKDTAVAYDVALQAAREWAIPYDVINLAGREVIVAYNLGDVVEAAPSYLPLRGHS